MSPRIFLVAALAIVLVGCAQLPSADYDVLRAKDTEGQLDHLELLRQQGEEIAGTPFVSGNKVTLLQDGAATYPAMLAAIRSAQHRIDMESFTFDEKEGALFVKALLQRHRAGVEVNLIYDAIGSDDTPPDLFDRLRRSGLHVVEYNPIGPGSIIDSSFNHRDHRKLLMIDGRIAFTGGLNVSQVYRLKLKLKHIFHTHNKDENLDPEHTPWRDTHVQIEGPVVGEFGKLFMQTWRDQKGDPILPAPSSTLKSPGNLWVQAIEGTPDKERYSIYKSLLVAIALAHKSIHLTAAFFVPTPELVDALKAAAERGIDVTLILPSYSDSDLSIEAGHSYYENLMESGVHIYELQGAVLHAKTAVIDGIWSSVGSSNLDWRSVLFNNECNAVILGAGFGDQMEAMFQNDLHQSQYIDPQEWGQRPLVEQLNEWKASLVEYFL